MNILLSAFACMPNRGSEPGVGWNFACELSKKHNVYLVTRTENRLSIKEWTDKHPHSTANITFFYYDLPSWFGFRDPRSFTIYFFYFFWQVGMFFHAKNWVKDHNIQLIHHLTYGVFRVPSLLVLLNIPFIFGPVGGGEKFPIKLRYGIKLRHHLLDILRDINNTLSTVNPLLWLTYWKSTLIVCKTQETLNRVPNKFHKKCIVSTEMGLNYVSNASHVKSNCKKHGVKLLFTGRLVYWKGLHLVFEAFAEIIKDFPLSELTIIGNGKDKEWLTDKSKSLGLTANIKWVNSIPQNELFELYSTFDMMVFPSMREAGGNVVIEALAYNLPVICLDLGGPSQVVNNKCGRIISTKGKNKSQVIQELYQELHHLIKDKRTINKLKKNTNNYAKRFLINTTVENIYSNDILTKALS
ncbi:glycosyltransferase [Porifericola rhodea]|uniref:glycosyltransferase n=1 Tax=Porifericola rhodea TaxID=930972 RepID=UPI002665589A|nr:glycosyltransferase [Porifericola rhodea]WKN32525.1 glycosyltransferase [Porifericola rhodea]